MSRSRRFQTRGRGFARVEMAGDCPIACLNPTDVRALARITSNAPSHPIFDIVARGKVAEVPEPYNPAIEANKQFRANKRGSDRPIEWSLPAHGSKGTQCGRFVPNTGIVCCPDSHIIRGRTYRCGRFDCPICYPWSVTRGAGRVADAIKAAATLYDSPVINHIVLSPPQREAIGMIGSEKGYHKLRKQATNIALDLGAIGGSIVFHPWRQNGQKDESDIEAIEDGRVSKDSNWRLGPHFHAVVLGWIDLERIATLYKTSGWVVKLVSPDIEPDRVGSVLAYCLSHAGIGKIEGKAHTLRTSNPFGVCAPTKVSIIADYKVSEPMTCPFCEKPIVDYKSYVDTCGGLFGEVKPALRITHTKLYCRTPDRAEKQAEYSQFNREEAVVWASVDRDVALIRPWSPMDIDPDDCPEEPVEDSPPPRTRFLSKWRRSQADGQGDSRRQPTATPPQ